MRLLTHQRKNLLSVSPKPSSFSSFTPLETLQSIDLNLSISRLLHKKSGAMIYDIRSNDKDRTFAPIVRTLPENDTGCPHILQHLACCGSQRYPIRDPFFNMLRRSVSTYMNAWTGDDFTAYPFSSPNHKDFNNLYKVYLDMCLKPLLNELDFRQEGWRYELNEETGNKEIKGIVFNEMKGAYENPDRQLYVEVANKLFTQTPFGYDSGGKPDSIVKLSYQQVKNMHSYYYHPSNMSFYYYGDTDISENLQYLQEHYLQNACYSNTIDRYQKHNSSLLQKFPTNPERFHRIQSHTSETPNVALTYNMGLLANAPSVDVACLNILSYLMLETNQALLYQEFIQSHLADSFGVSGFNVGSVLAFNVSLKNVVIKDQEFFQKVENCLKRIIENGVDEVRMEEYVRQAQLNILTPKKTQGIRHLQSCLPYMVNRLPLNNLAYIRSHLSSAVKKLQNKAQLTQLINKYFLANNRKVVVFQEPASQTSSDPYADIKGLDMPSDFIANQQKELKRRQESVKDNSVECLPKLQIKDVQASVKKEFKIEKMGNTLEGNQLREISVGIDIPEINFVRVVFRLDMSNPETSKLLPFLDLWKYTLTTGIATPSLLPKQLSSKLSLSCNNFDISLQKPSQSDENAINIVFSASCLQKNMDQYLGLLKDIINTPVFGWDNVANVFRAYRMDKIQELLDANVMQFCLDYGSAVLGGQPANWNTYQWVTKGIQVAGDAKTAPVEFQQIHEQLRKSADMTVILHSNKFQSGIPQKLGFNYSSNSFPTPKKSGSSSPATPNPPSTSITNSYSINFCSQQYRGPKYLSKQHALLVPFIEILEQDYLHQKIREKGGAYGARAVYRDVGTIALYSYMDPYAMQTYAAFDESVQQLLGANVLDSRLEEVKIKVIGGLEAPIVPQDQALATILKNYSLSERSQYISNIREAKWSDIKEAGRKYLVGTPKSRIMFGKQVPTGFTQQKLAIPKQESTPTPN